MNIREFLRELLFFFPLERKLDEEQTTRFLESYVDDILYSLEKYEDYDCNYKKLLQNIRMNYEYRKFPSIADIVKFIPKALVPKPVSYSGHEGKVIKRIINGYEYEFTVVPCHWENVKSITELDAEIRRKKQKGDYYDTGEKSA